MGRHANLPLNHRQQKRVAFPGPVTWEESYVTCKRPKIGFTVIDITVLRVDKVHGPPG